VGLRSGGRRRLRQQGIDRWCGDAGRRGSRRGGWCGLALRNPHLSVHAVGLAILYVAEPGSSSYRGFWRGQGRNVDGGRRRAGCGVGGVEQGVQTSEGDGKRLAR
jgi:hypothetical protein